MSTTITPALGHGAPFTQLGDGTSPGYDAIDLRRAHADLHSGVLEGGSYLVSERFDSPNLSVDIAASSGKGAVVEGTAVYPQGCYTVPPNDSLINEEIDPPNQTDPRIDIVVLEVKDDTHDSSGLNLSRTRVVNGTPVAGANLVNRDGASPVPESAILLADVLVSPNDVAITNSEINDRRELATGRNTPITSLPANPVIGQEAYLEVQGPFVFSADPPPQIWHLRWSGSGWDSIGGAPVYAIAGTGGNAWATLSTQGSWYAAPGRPEIVLPCPGVYDVEFSTNLTRSTSTGIYNISIGLGLDDVNPSYTGDATSTTWSGANSLITLSGKNRIAANTTVDLRLFLHNTDLSFNFKTGQIFVTPVRLEPETVFTAYTYDLVAAETAD